MLSFFYFPMKVAGGHIYCNSGNSRPQALKGTDSRFSVCSFIKMSLSAGTGKLCIFGHLGLVFIWSCFVSRLLFLLYYVICAPVLTEGTIKMLFFWNMLYRLCKQYDPVIMLSKNQSEHSPGCHLRLINLNICKLL